MHTVTYLKQEQRALADQLATAEAQWRALDDGPDAHLTRDALAERLIGLREQTATMPDRIALAVRRERLVTELANRLAELEATVNADLGAMISALPSRERMLHMVTLDTEARSLRHLLSAHDSQVSPPDAVTAARKLTRALAMLGSSLDVALRVRPRGGEPMWTQSADAIRELQGAVE